MTTVTPAPFTPLAVLTAATTVITARGYYQPLSRQWEPAIPTAMDVTNLLYGGEPYERGDKTRFARAARATRTTPPAVFAWCREGAAAEPGSYRAKLAAMVTRQVATDRDVPLLVSAVAQWRSDQDRAQRAAQAAADAEHSTHQGSKDERITRRVTVAAVIEQASKTYGYTTQARYLIKMRDAEGNIYVWPARPRDASTLPQRGTTADITATVTRHDTYRETAQTYVTKLRWKPAPTA